jgi:hypothetical protein
MGMQSHPRLLIRKVFSVRIPLKTRANRSKYRQLLHKALAVWVQREADMGAAAALGVTGVPEKLDFIRQEQAKLRKKLASIDRGFGKQRAWSQGKLIY